MNLIGIELVIELEDRTLSLLLHPNDDILEKIKNVTDRHSIPHLFDLICQEVYFKFNALLLRQHRIEDSQTALESGSRLYDNAVARERRREVSAELVKRIRETEESKELSFTPIISERSRQIVKSRSKEKVENRLIKKANELKVYSGIRKAFLFAPEVGRKLRVSPDLHQKLYENVSKSRTKKERKMDILERKIYPFKPILSETAKRVATPDLERHLATLARPKEIVLAEPIVYKKPKANRIKTEENQRDKGFQKDSRNLEKTLNLVKNEELRMKEDFKKMAVLTVVDELDKNKRNRAEKIFDALDTKKKGTITLQDCNVDILPDAVKEKMTSLKKTLVNKMDKEKFVQLFA